MITTGRLIGFARIEVFHARDYFDRTGSPTPFLSGLCRFTAGAPIVKKKLFAFGQYENMQSSGASSTTVATVLTPSAAANISNPTSRAYVCRRGIAHIGFRELRAQHRATRMSIPGRCAPTA